MYNTMLDALLAGANDNDVLARIKEHPELAAMRANIEQQETAGKSFSRGIKNAAFLREAIEGAPRCKICGARMHARSISTDHIVARVDGGSGMLSNAQPTHPYCNSSKPRSP
jgi:hypothetical protein